MAAEPLTQAAAARHRRAVERAEHALRDLDREGRRSTFNRSRGAQCLAPVALTQPLLRAEIEQLRQRALARPDGVPARQRATEASLRQRLETLRAENRRLRDENANLKTELATAYGQLRERQDR